MQLSGENQVVLKKNLPPNWAKPRVPLKTERKTWSRPIRKGRFCVRAEGFFGGGNSTRPTNFGRNQFEFFRKHTSTESRL